MQIYTTFSLSYKKTITMLRMNEEVERSLVGLADFKSDERFEKAFGGFDSHALPPIKSLP